MRAPRPSNTRIAPKLPSTGSLKWNTTWSTGAFEVEPERGSVLSSTAWPKALAGAIASRHATAPIAAQSLTMPRPRSGVLPRGPRSRPRDAGGGAA